MAEGLNNNELSALTGLTKRQIRYTTQRVPGMLAGMPWTNWFWSRDEVRRWQVATALSQGRTGLEPQNTPTSLINAVKAVWAGLPPAPTRWVTLSGGVVSYVDDCDEDMAVASGTVLLVLMPNLWPTKQGEAMS